MSLSQEETEAAREADNVGRFVDPLGRDLFEAERYEDLEEAFRTFRRTISAGTQSHAHFYETRLPALVTHYLITQHLESGTELSWERNFSGIIVSVNPGLQGDASAKSLRSYMGGESRKGRPLRELVDEIVATCQAFRRRQ